MMRKRPFLLALLLPLLLGLGSCASAHLVRWGTDQPSGYYEPDGEVSRGILKPFVTVVGLPVAFAWDVATFPFQILFGVHPYGDRYMKPGEVRDI